MPESRPSIDCQVEEGWLAHPAFHLEADARAHVPSGVSGAFQPTIVRVARPIRAS